MTTTNDIDERTDDKIIEFERADEEFREQWTQFEEEHQEELEMLELIRERRNSKLDDAIRSMRENVGDLDHDIKAIERGKFKATRKWSSFYSPDIFIAISNELGIFDEMVHEGIVTYEIKIHYDRAKLWLRERGLEDRFMEAEDGRENSAALYVPKPIPSLGAEKK